MPFKMMVPLVVGSRPAMDSSTRVFPEPVGPSSVKNAPFLTVRLTCLKAEAGQFNRHVLKANHGVPFLGTEKILSSRNRIRQTIISQTATGWEYLRPYAVNRS